MCAAGSKLTVVADGRVGNFCLFVCLAAPQGRCNWFGCKKHTARSSPIRSSSATVPLLEHIYGIDFQKVKETIDGQTPVNSLCYLLSILYLKCDMQKQTHARLP